MKSTKPIIAFILLLLMGLSAAEGQLSTQGRDFWVMFMSNNGTGTMSLFAAGDTASSITVSVPCAGWSNTVTLNANSYVTITLPQNYVNPYYNDGLGYRGVHVSSNHNISLYASNYLEYTFDITTVLPTPSLRTHYITQDYPSIINGGYTATTEIGMVATTDNTHVNVLLTTATLEGHTSGSNVQLTLDAGQSYQFRSSGTSSFSGTEITSDQPLAVFQGNQSSNVPSYYVASDHLYEQAIPVDYWGKDFVLVPLAQRNGMGDRVRVTTSENNCQIHIDGEYLTSLPAKGTYEFNLNSGVAHRLTTTKPATVCLYVSGGDYGGQPGDPSSVIIPPVEQGVYSVVFNAYATSQITYHYTNVVCLTENVSGMRLDGNNISSQFSVLDSLFSYAKISVSSGTHKMTNESGKFSAFFYGLGTWESYAYTAGMALRNLRNTLYADSIDTENLPTGLRICPRDTVLFDIQSNATEATWLINGVEQNTNALHLEHRFDSVGTYIVQALLHKEYTLSQFDTLTTYVTVYLLRGADVHLTVCDSGYTRYGYHFDSTGVYDVIIPNDEGCDSIFTLYLTVNHSSVAGVYDTVVENQLPVIWNGHTFTSDTVYPVTTLTNAVGCDSLIAYSLKVHWNVHTSADTVVCDNHLPIQWHGLTFNAPGSQDDTLSTSFGADSVVTRTLSLAPTWTDTLRATICDSSWADASHSFLPLSYPFEDSTYSLAGTYSRLLHTVGYGCDSLRVLVLTIRQATTGDTVANECDNFSWYGSTYTSSTDSPKHTSVNDAHCDSVITLHLTLRYSTTSTFADTVIENLLPHTFNGAVFSDSTSHSLVTIANSVGCDSTIAYSLFVHWNVDTNLYDTLCNDALPILWNGKTFALLPTSTTLQPYNSTTLSDTIVRTNRFGADSTVHMHLTVHPLFDHHQYSDLCDNDSLLFGDSTFFGRDGSTSHTDTLLSFHSCDSLSSLHLTVHPTFDHHLFDTICTNTSYLWGTPQRQMLPPDSIEAFLPASDTANSTALQPYSSTTPTDTSFTDMLLSVHGCDSLSSLHLHLFPAYSFHFYDTICDASLASIGDDSLALWNIHTYPFEDTTYNTTGTYTHHFSTLQCDSLRTLHLKVYPTYDLHFYDTIYDGDSYTFESTLYDTTGIYPHQLSTLQCDSLRTLHLQRNRRTYIDSLVCQNSLPLTWYGGVLFEEGEGLHTATMQVIKDSVHLQGKGGIDSLLVMTLIVRDTSSTVDEVHSCDSLIWYHHPDTTYRASTSMPFLRLQQTTDFDTTGLQSQLPSARLSPYTTHLSPFALQCDSVRHLDLTIDYTHYTTDHVIACDSTRWPLTTGHWPLSTFYRDTLGIVGPLGSFIVQGPVDTLVTVGGCDSVVNLDLAIRHATYECAIDTFCWDQTYTWRTQFAPTGTISPTSHHYYYLTDTLQTHTFVHPDNPQTVITCDSVLAISLTQMAKPELNIIEEIDCRERLYRLQIETDMPYFYWVDLTTTSPTSSSTILASPDVTATYRATVDYHSQPLCPLSDSLTLRPIVVPVAEMKVNPEALAYNAMDFDAYDLTLEEPRSIHPDEQQEWSRTWYINDEEQGATSPHLHGEVLPDRDTVKISLDVYNGQCHGKAHHLLPVNRVALLAPNVFTPLLDQNNLFTIVGQGIIDGELYIYNREGLLVFHTKDFTTGWNGKSDNGQTCQQGSYVWKLIYHSIDRPASTRTEIGTVLLLH